MNLAHSRRGVAFTSRHLPQPYSQDTRTIFPWRPSVLFRSLCTFGHPDVEVVIMSRECRDSNLVETCYPVMLTNNYSHYSDIRYSDMHDITIFFASADSTPHKLPLHPISNN